MCSLGDSLGFRGCLTLKVKICYWGTCFLFFASFVLGERLLIYSVERIAGLLYACTALVVRIACLPV